ncbi:MAG: hypothetical protein KDB37_20160, partial [Ilumatobacter sp.]|nr:hypothetical protein [Ilumatobacter sp.]
GETVDPGELDSLFADNVFPDDDVDRRATRARDHGPLSVDTWHATSDAAAAATCTGPGGRHTITFSLAPNRPLRIQDYEVSVSGA